MVIVMRKLMVILLITQLVNSRHCVDELFESYDPSIPPSNGTVNITTQARFDHIWDIASSGTFKVVGFLRFRWFDPRLIYTPTNDCQSPLVVWKYKTWRPDVHISNSIDSSNIDVRKYLLVLCLALVY
eukprot:TRINITY_DN6857_c0_g1_i2.p1 TRINITY_DN6857_c0_g1~~TRINITY_DN6857_c0_g1_i2.p1  ORF type:complete len:128 (-),score=4.71 TRINITY_DN6857_c0_g1_i2:114-497(-)